MRSTARAWGLAITLALVLSLAAGVPAARAGEWIQVSCVNPNGSAAPSEGWAGFSSGAGYGSTASSACAPGTPMTAELSADVPEPVYNSVGLTYTPPPGSTLVGGGLGLVLSGDGAGTDATGDALVDEPAEVSGDVRIQCAQDLADCSSSGSDYSGEFTLPANLGGDLYIVAGCDGSGGYSCDSGGRNGAWALAQVSSADLLLQNDATPAASKPTGSALDKQVHGTAQLTVRATDPDGPGVFKIAATIDGKTVYSAIPSRNDGECRSVGTDKTTGALEFDDQQPCPEAVTKTISVPTAKLPDGDHQLQVSVTDAAGNTATVLNRTIHTDNARETPKPPRGLQARFLISWRWDHRVTRLLGLSARDVPGGAQVAFSCSGAHCPALHDDEAREPDLGHLLRALAGANFSAGDRLLIVVSAPDRTAERVALTIENGRRPVARLVHSSHR